MGSELAEEGFIGSVLPAIILTCEPQLCALFESNRQCPGSAVATDVCAVLARMPECHRCENLREEQKTFVVLKAVLHCLGDSCFTEK